MIERKTKRYNFKNHKIADFSLDESKIGIDLNNLIEAKPVNISLKGISFIFSGLNEQIINEIEMSNSFYLKLFFD